MSYINAPSAGAGVSDGAELIVETDFAAAAVPKNDFARDLQTIRDTLEAAGNIGNLKFVAQGGARIYYVNPYVLRIKPGWNCRDHNSASNREHVLKLAAMIAKDGVETALTVHLEDGHFYITDGHCRYLAVMHAINHLGAVIKTIPIAEENKYSSEDGRLASQISRNTGKQLEPLEQAELFHRLVKFGWSEQQIAEKAGLSRDRIIQILELHAYSTPMVKKMISDGDVKPSFVGRVIRKAKKSPYKVEQILSEAVIIANLQGKTKASAKHVAVIETEAQYAPAGNAKAAGSTIGEAEKLNRTSLIQDKLATTPEKTSAVFGAKNFLPIAVEAEAFSPAVAPADTIRLALLSGKIFKSDDRFMIELDRDLFYGMCRAVGIYERTFVARMQPSSTMAPIDSEV